MKSVVLTRDEHGRPLRLRVDGKIGQVLEWNDAGKATKIKTIKNYKDSEIKAFLTGAGQDLTGGFSDEIEAFFTPQSAAEVRDKHAALRSANPKSFEGGEWAGLGGSALAALLGAVPSGGASIGAFLAKQGLKKGATAAAKAVAKRNFGVLDVLKGTASGGVYGGASGVGYGDKLGTGASLKEIAGDAKLGAKLGAGLGGGLGLGKLGLAKVKKSFQPELQNFKDGAYLKKFNLLPSAKQGLAGTITQRARHYSLGEKRVATKLSDYLEKNNVLKIRKTGEKSKVAISKHLSSLREKAIEDLKEKRKPFERLVFDTKKIIAEIENHPTYTYAGLKNAMEENTLIRNFIDDLGKKSKEGKITGTDFNVVFKHASANRYTEAGALKSNKEIAPILYGVRNTLRKKISLAQRTALEKAEQEYFFSNTLFKNMDKAVVDQTGKIGLGERLGVVASKVTGAGAGGLLGYAASKHQDLGFGGTLALTGAAALGGNRYGGPALRKTLKSLNTPTKPYGAFGKQPYTADQQALRELVRLMKEKEQEK